MHRTATLLLRRTALCRVRGRMSSMLDMGGVPAADTDTRIDVGKNNKVQAVALDFNLITCSIQERHRRALGKQEEVSEGGGTRILKSTSAALAAPIKPDASLVEKMASLLNVQLGGDSPKLKQPEGDDLSAIIGSSNTKKEFESENAKKSEPEAKALVHSSPHIDIRSKYAAKLRKKIDGGVAGLDLAKSEREDTLKHGDAAVHLVARDMASSEGSLVESSSALSSRWLATTGAAKLLSFLTDRSMKIALLPLPSTPDRPQYHEDVKQTQHAMESLAKQLPHVKFDLLIADGRRRGERETSNENAAKDVMNKLLSRIDTQPLKFMVVSDRDDYLKAARDNGMFTIRIRPKNKRRGNFTTNYTVENLGGVQEVVNEINGISFNSALN